MKLKARLASLFLSAAALATIVGDACAQPVYPNKPIHMIVPFSAGGPSDVLARAIGQKLGDNVGQPVIIENRPGAGGNIASDYVAKSPPDGYTLMIATVGTHAINASLYSKLPFDTVRDFAPIALVASATIILVAHPSVPAKTIKELVTLAKSKPNQLSYASPGSGTPQHLAGELLDTVTGIEMVHVPYKGAAPALNDLLGGQVSLGFVSLPAALPHVKAGKLRALGVTAAKRSDVAPDVPTIEEAGVPGYEVENWYGVLAPAGTPKEIVNKLNTEILKLLKTKEVKELLDNQGFEILQSSPEQFAAFEKTELVKWAKLVKLSGAKAD
jgi:tripartite-type tricarboxylate transporter receptor subunit TctC